ncbi:MAG: ABC transporter ATP-binding protein [Chloroflexi bacterium]|nr:MAG: ABC transporter ATP-binding protein [Chloroflexota bacterium]
MYLTLEQISKTFPARGGSGEVKAVIDADLQIEQGELVTLLGPSGCGKTTTLRMLAGFEFPTTGKIRLDGKIINDLPPNKRDMSMVFQSYAIFPHLNIFENVAYGLNVQHLSRSEITRRVGKVMELVELSGYEKRAPNQLSGGQQQRVALARALVMEPKVLLMDEPLSNLDAKLRESMRTEIRSIQRRLGITSVYVTHDQIEAMTLSDRIVVMNGGLIEQVGTPVEIYRFPRTRFVAGFIGRANFIEARVVNGQPANLVVKVYDQTIFLSKVKSSYPEGARMTLIARPEMIRINQESNLKGTVRRASYLGNFVDYDIDVAGQLITAVDNDPRQASIYTEGTTVGIELLADCIHILPA